MGAFYQDATPVSDPPPVEEEQMMIEPLNAGENKAFRGISNNEISPLKMDEEQIEPIHLNPAVFNREE
jgi:hypothetical protein